MKKQILFLILIMTTISCNSKTIETKLNDSIYFSIKSPCNIKINFVDRKNVILNINGKIIKGKIDISKIDLDYFRLEQNKKLIFTFTYEDSNIIIANQKYEFGCESSKIVVMDKFINDKLFLNEFKKYEKDTPYIFDDIDLINDKAFYLEQLKCYVTSEYILGKILILQPKRVFAWLNLADVNWKQNKKESAKKYYQKYISLMKSQVKDLKKIPKRVYDRIK